MHPFGGLQVFGFKAFFRKRGDFHPLKVKIVATERKRAVVEDPPLVLRMGCTRVWNMIAQKHPAQGNNSNLDYEVGSVLKPNGHPLPLEKGLGYRIIKRESDKDLVIEDRSTWPTAECFITDLFGKQDLWSFPITTALVGSPEHLKKITNMPDLIEVSLDTIKIQQKGKPDFVWPLFSKDSSIYSCNSKQIISISDYQFCCLCSCENNHLQQFVDRIFSFCKGLANWLSISAEEKLITSDFLRVAMKLSDILPNLDTLLLKPAIKRSTDLHHQEANRDITETQTIISQLLQDLQKSSHSELNQSEWERLKSNLIRFRELDFLKLGDWVLSKLKLKRPEFKEDENCGFSFCLIKTSQEVRIDLETHPDLQKINESTKLKFVSNIGSYRVLENSKAKHINICSKMDPKTEIQIPIPDAILQNDLVANVRAIPGTERLIVFNQKSPNLLFGIIELGVAEQYYRHPNQPVAGSPWKLLQLDLQRDAGSYIIAVDINKKGISVLFHHSMSQQEHVCYQSFEKADSKDMWLKVPCNKPDGFVGLAQNMRIFLPNGSNHILLSWACQSPMGDTIQFTLAWTKISENPAQLEEISYHKIQATFKTTPREMLNFLWLENRRIPYHIATFQKEGKQGLLVHSFYKQKFCPAGRFESGFFPISRTLNMHPICHLNTMTGLICLKHPLRQGKGGMHRFVRLLPDF